MAQRTRILITGASGYIRFCSKTRLESIIADLADAERIKALLLENGITIVIETADSVNFATAKACIEGLAAVKTQAGAEKVHFFHTSGAKLFSSHTGIDATKPLSDMNDAIYDVQRAQRSPHAGMQAVLPLNPRIVDFADSLGVRSYIVVPPMVYGRGQGFGNKISIQIVALVKVSKALGKAFLVDRTQTSWVLCHVLDLCSLYTAILRRILQGNPPPSGKNGFYFAENGRFPWAALWKGIAARMLERNLFGVVDANPVQATSEDLVQMGGVLKQPPKFVPVSVAGSCWLKGDNGRAIGWRPKYGVDHLLASVGDETDFIIQELDKTVDPKL